MRELAGVKWVTLIPGDIVKSVFDIKELPLLVVGTEDSVTPGTDKVCCMFPSGRSRWYERFALRKL